MSRILVIAEHDGRHVLQSTARCMSCAVEIDRAGADVAVFAAEAGTLGTEAASIRGVKKVTLVLHPAHAAQLAAVLAPQIAAMAHDYDYVLGPSTTFGKDLMPRVAALLGAGQVSDVMAVLGPRSFKRPIYAGNAIATIEVPEGETVVATVRGASFRPAEGGGEGAIETVNATSEIPSHTRFRELKTAGGERPDLQTARIVISGGRGVGSAANFDHLYRLADSLGAAVGASRAAVDAGYVANDMQIGQTGKIIAPELYMAFGISGAIQHLTGIKDAGTIVAINKDAEAPIFEVADIGLVGDLFEIIPQLEKCLA